MQIRHDHEKGIQKGFGVFVGDMLHSKPRHDWYYNQLMSGLLYLVSLGIKRKRIRGDVWRYKEVCKQIIEATHL